MQASDHPIMRDKELEKTASKLIDELIRLRKEQGLSHEKLADMTGLHRSTISLIESKKRNPTVITCLKLCKALNARLCDLLKKVGA